MKKETLKIGCFKMVSKNFELDTIICLNLATILAKLAKNSKKFPKF